jgi:hypothetical protein
MRQSLGSEATGETPPEAYHVVERFSAALSAGDAGACHGMLAGITRVLDTEGCDALLRVAAVGLWRHGGSYVRPVSSRRSTCR